MKTLINKYLYYIPYIVFMVMTIFYVKIIVSLLHIIEAIKSGGYVKLFEEKLPVWQYQTTDNLILHEKFLISFFIFMYVLACILIKRKIILSLFVPLIFIFLERIYIDYRIIYY